jgi:hypothetical protein
MDAHKIVFDELEWQSSAPGSRFKLFRDGSRQVRLVEFSCEFVEAEACEKAHIGFVLSGELEIDFSGNIVRHPEARPSHLILWQYCKGLV